MFLKGLRQFLKQHEYLIGSVIARFSCNIVIVSLIVSIETKNSLKAS